MDAAILRPQLLTLRRRLLLVAGVAAGLLAACDGPAPLDPAYQPAADAALDYLATTDDELGLDVVMAVQVHAVETGDPRALEVAEARRAALRPEVVERYGVLLEIDKSPLPPATLDESAAGPAPPRPDDDLDDRVATCPEALLECRVPPECVEFVELDDRGGYVLTHQALWLLFHEWMGCRSEVDVDARRRVLAARLALETEAYPEPSDLHAERLAMLGHLGFADAIEPAWIDRLVSGQAPSGCFPVDEAIPCHPHPTGLALWALAHGGRAR